MNLDVLLENLLNGIENHTNIITFSSFAFLVSLILTPLVGKLAKRIGAIDLPAQLRLRTDRTKDQRIHKTAKLRLGGIGIFLAVLSTIFISSELTSEIVGISVGLIIIFIVGFLDDRFELSSKIQFLAQIAAATAAVVGGITVPNIDIAGLSIDLTVNSIQLFTLGEYVYNFSYPADIITIIWIVAMINAVNWMCGIDALGEVITIITASAIGFISIHTGNVGFALVSFILAASVLGFLPYNFPPSKIMGGSISDYSFGFLLSTLAILSQAKLTTTLLILIIPTLDMIYVLLRRVFEHKVVNPVKLMGISGRIHLHHRMINFGFSEKTTLYLESIFFMMVALLSIYFEDVIAEFRYLYIIGFSILAIGLVIIIINQINVINRKKKRKIKRAKIIEDITPEEKYKY